MDGELKAVIREKVTQGLTAGMPVLTRREVYLPRVPGKALAVIGMRRSGKTSFLWQCMADQLATGAPRESLLYFNFEDDRLDGLAAKDLHHLIEIYYQLHPGFRDKKTVRLYLDEIQLVRGWESFVRRVMDSEKVEIMLTGSSARLLSREIATSMRGRALEVLVHPFSFREYLAHHEAMIGKPFSQLTKAARSSLLRHFDGYLKQGGFPEVQSAAERDRDALLRSYVDVAMLRDVIERHAVSNPTALRWLVRQLLGNAAGMAGPGALSKGGATPSTTVGVNAADGVEVSTTPRAMKRLRRYAANRNVPAKNSFARTMVVPRRTCASPVCWARRSRGSMRGRRS